MDANPVSPVTYRMFKIVAVLFITVSAVSSRSIGRNVADGETPVKEFRGIMSVMNNHSASVNLTFMIQPINATVFGIKFFKDENQVYGFSFSNPENFGASSEFHGRLVHNVYRQADAIVFQLALSDPQSSDTGVYIAFLYGSGSDVPLEARLNLTYGNANTPNASNYKAGNSGEKAGSNIIVPIFAILIAVILVIAIPITVNKWKKRIDEKHQKKQFYEETSSLQKPGENEEKSSAKFELKRFLCHTSGPTDDRRSKDSGDKEDEADGR